METGTKQMNRTPKATLKLNTWELLAIEEALRAKLVDIDNQSLNSLIEKIANAEVK